MPYTALQMILDDAFPPNARAYFKAEFMDELTDEAIDDIIETAAEPTSPMSQVLLEPMGGAMLDTPESETALAVRNVKWCYHALSMWMDPSQEAADAHVGWAKGLKEAIKPHTRDGVYLNFTSEDDDERVRSTYGPKYDRLQELKAKYDPQNVFHNNSNIKPAG